METFCKVQWFRTNLLRSSVIIMMIFEVRWSVHSLVTNWVSNSRGNTTCYLFNCEVQLMMIHRWLSLRIGSSHMFNLFLAVFVLSISSRGLMELKRETISFFKWCPKMGNQKHDWGVRGPRPSNHLWEKRTFISICHKRHKRISLTPNIATPSKSTIIGKDLQENII